MKHKMAIVHWKDSSYYNNAFNVNERDFPLINIISVGFYLGENKSKDSILLSQWYVPAHNATETAEIKKIEAIPKKLIIKMVIKDIKL